MNNDVELIPVKGVLPTVQTQSDNVIYIPQAHKNKPGIVKEGDGINIENGVVSLNKQTVEDMIDANKWVSYGFEQNLTEDEKGIARHNIGAGANEFTGSWLDLANRPQKTIDFAEEERLKGKNLLLLKNYGVTTGGISVSVSGEDQTITFNGTASQWSSVNIRIPLRLKLKKNIKYSFTHKSVQGFSANYPVIMGRYAGTPPFTFTAAEDEEITSMTLTIPANTRFVDVVSAYQVEKGEVSTAYVPAVGDIMRQNDAPIRFAETERLKSENNNYILHLDNVDDALSNTSKEPVQNKVLYDPVTFAESERQKSKNLLDINKIKEQDNIRVVDDTVICTLWYRPINQKLSEIADLEVGKTYVFSFNTTSSRQTLYLTGSYTGEIWQGRPYTITQEMLDSKLVFYSAQSGSTNPATYSNMQIEEGTVATDYQPYNGAITHNNDAPVVFAEAERQKSKNLFDGQFRQGNVAGSNLTNRIFSIHSPRIKKGVTYTVSTNLDVSVFRYAINYNSQPYPNSQTDYDLGWVTNNSFTFTAEIDGYLGIPVSRNNNADLTPDDISSYWWQVEEGSVATDYLVYQGGGFVQEEQLNDFIHEKQLNESTEKRELLYQHTDAINLRDSTLTTLDEFFKMFDLDTTKTYRLSMDPNMQQNFKDVVGNPPRTSDNNYRQFLVKMISTGTTGSGAAYHPYRIYKIIAGLTGYVTGIKYVKADANNIYVQGQWNEVL